MSGLLRKAFDQVSKLDQDEQDSVAKWLLDELASERRWDERFAGSSEGLRKLAGEALDEHRAGLTHPLDTEEL